MWYSHTHNGVYLVDLNWQGKKKLYLKGSVFEGLQMKLTKGRLAGEKTDLITEEMLTQRAA